MKKYDDLEEIAYIEYYKDFIGLTDKQKALLVYRKVLEIVKRINYGNTLDINEILKSDVTDKVAALIIASDFHSKIIKTGLCYVNALMVEVYRNIYMTSYQSYNKILESYSKLASELHLTSSLELAHLFTYMLWNGYYSVNKEHAYKLQDRLLIPGLYSFDVIKGGGVCLAYSELLKNFLLACGINSASVQCKVSEKIKADYKPEIDRKIKSSTFSKLSNRALACLLKGVINHVGNHAVTLVEENGKYYIYDSTNLVVLNVMDVNKATFINGTGNFELKLFSTLCNTPDADPKHLIEGVVNGNCNPAFARKEIIFSFEETLELIKSNIALLDDAYDNIHHELEIIDKETDEIGGYVKTIRKVVR